MAFGNLSLEDKTGSDYSNIKKYFNIKEAAAL